MRALLGEPDRPGSAYILVIRGIYDEGYTYWLNHQKLYPTWGCLLFPDRGEVFEFRPEIVHPITEKEVISGSHIHKIYSAEFNEYSDEAILGLVRKIYHEYSDEDDPIISGDYTLDDSSLFKKIDTDLEDVISTMTFATSLDDLDNS